MNKTILRYLVVALTAVALGLLIYHINQPAGTAAFGSGVNGVSQFSEGLGSEHDIREGGASLISGLFGVTGNLLLVAIITTVVVSARKLFARQPQQIRVR